MAAILDIQSERFNLYLISKTPWYLLPNFESVGLRFRRKLKIDILASRHGGHLGFPIGMILAIFDLQATLILPTKFRVSWPFGSREEFQNRFSRLRPWRPDWISSRNEFSCYWSASHPHTFYQISGQLASRFGEEAEIDFQYDRRGVHLGYPIRTSRAVFDL